MKILEGADEYIARWMQKTLLDLNLQKYVALGIMDDDKIIAGIAYHNFMKNYNNIEISMVAVSPKWATKNIIKTLLAYPFEQLGCQRITTCTPAKNIRAIRFNLGIGFKHEGTIRRGCGEDDMIICGMLRKEAQKWLGK